MLQVQRSDLDDEQIEHALEIFKEHEDSLSGSYIERRLNRFDTNIFTMEDELKYMFREIESKESLCKEIILELFTQARIYLADSKEKYNQLQIQNHRLKSEIAELKDDIETRNQDDLKASMAYEQLQGKLSQLEDVQVNMHDQFEQEKQQIRKTFIAEVDNKPCELEFQMLVDQNRHLVKQAAENKRNNQLLTENLRKMESTIEKLEAKLDKSEGVIEQLKNAIQHKDETIIALTHVKEEEIDDNFISSQKDLEIPHPDDKQHSELIVPYREILVDELDENKLNLDNEKIFSYTDKILDRMQMNIPDLPPINPDVLNVRSVQSVKKVERLFIDPYYAHYVLTSQSVKIKQDLDDCLDVDMKSHYTEIIDKRIPMHLWDQWIKNKLKELSKSGTFEME